MTADHLAATTIVITAFAICVSELSGVIAIDETMV